jgi:hypothetical protein
MPTDNPPLYGLFRHRSITGATVAGRLVSLSSKSLNDGAWVSEYFKTLIELINFIYTASRGLMRITSLGFQFLLHSPHAQLWELLLQYLHMAEVTLKRHGSRSSIHDPTGTSNGSD